MTQASNNSQNLLLKVKQINTASFSISAFDRLKQPKKLLGFQELVNHNSICLCCQQGTVSSEQLTVSS